MSHKTRAVSFRAPRGISLMKNCRALGALCGAQLLANVKRRGAGDETDPDGVMARAQNESDDESPGPAQLDPLPNRFYIRAHHPSSCRVALTLRKSILRVLCALSELCVYVFSENLEPQRTQSTQRSLPAAADVQQRERRRAARVARRLERRHRAGPMVVARGHRRRSLRAAGVDDAVHPAAANRGVVVHQRI